MGAGMDTGTHHSTQRAQSLQGDLQGKEVFNWKDQKRQDGEHRYKGLDAGQKEKKE